MLYSVGHRTSQSNGTRRKPTNDNCSTYSIIHQQHSYSPVEKRCFNTRSPGTHITSTVDMCCCYSMYIHICTCCMIRRMLSDSCVRIISSGQCYGGFALNTYWYILALCMLVCVLLRLLSPSFFFVFFLSMDVRES